MSPFLAIADLADGRFAVVAIDPIKRLGGGCSATVQSLHRTRAEAASAMSAGTAETAQQADAQTPDSGQV